MSFRMTERRALAAFGGAVSLAVSGVASEASACGGFFCSQASPVDQAAERIIFAQDEDGHVTQIVEVLYDGPSENFSWVLPVPGIPEPSVGSRQVFDRLQAATNPNYSLNSTNGCPNDPIYDDVVLEAGGDPSPPPSVVVLDSGSVGPFDYETISVSVADDDPADVAVRWLEDNGYDVGPLGGEVLRPYLQNGLNLIAFRLQKGQSTGAIRPIVLEYEASTLAIPIRPTAVAAKDDMPVLVWTLGSERAVPTNYLDLELNELLIDWFNYRSTYDAVVTAAADEAGGQGFVTEYAGAGEAFISAIEPQPSDVDRALATDPAYTELRDVLSIITAQLGTYDGFIEAASAHLLLREGVSVEEFVSCAYCYFEGGEVGGGVVLEPASESDPIFGTDMDAFRAALTEEVLQPFFDLGELMRENPYLTRLYTTMSAEEMTVDPVFEFNPDAPDVSNVHEAEISRDCESGTWQVVLPSGEVVHGEEFEWPYALGETELPINVRTVQFSAAGAPELISDNEDTIHALHSGEPASSAPPGSTSGGEARAGGGGCAYGGSSLGVSSTGRRGTFWGMLGLSLGWALLRRRRAR
jgi:hypothetical protein